jgi:hypothetical protein
MVAIYYTISSFEPDQNVMGHGLGFISQGQTFQVGSILA